MSKGAVDRPSSILRTLVSPVASPLAAAGRSTTTFFGNVFSINRVVEENRKLKEQATAVAQYQETVNDLWRTIDDLRKLQGFGVVQNKTRVPANIIGFSINENRLSIDVGSNQGVSAGDPVESSNGLVGTIEDVEANRSQILLLTSAGLQQTAGGKAFLIGAIDASRNPPPAGLLRGENANTVSLTFQDPKAPVQIGDVIITSGFSPKIPRGLIIGKVIQVEPNEVYGDLKARIDPAYSVGSTNVVFVLK